MTKDADADGSVRFTLDESKHCPFDVAARLMRAAGAPEHRHDLAQREAALRFVMAEQAAKPR